MTDRIQELRAAYEATTVDLSALPIALDPTNLAALAEAYAKAYAAYITAYIAATDAWREAKAALEAAEK